MKKTRKRWIALAALLPLALAAAFFLYMGDYYRAEDTAVACLSGSDAVSVSRSGDAWLFDGPGTETALIFYPGAKVEAAAYAPLLCEIAAGGVDAFLVEMPFRFALFGINSADALIADSAYRHYCMAGHSLGGVAASSYAAAHPASVEALVLLASYPTKTVNEETRLLSIYGSSDDVMKREAYEKAKALWPNGAEELVLAGGNHAQFGAYGPQKGDGTAVLSPERQRQDTAAAILRFLGADTAAEENAFPEPTGLRIAVATDLHLDPDNTNKATTRLSAAAYNLEIADALLWDARQQGASLLLLTGDLVNGGKPERHEAMAEKLRRAEEDGLSVYVLPGNHDLAPVGQRDFAAFYADFGFDEAYSRDSASLSYCVLREELALLMLDTGGYTCGAIDLPGAEKRDNSEALLSETTLRWIETMLQEAKRRALPVLCAGHFNLLPAYSRAPENSGYSLENGERLAVLLREYGVPLYLSGHLHVRGVYQEDGLTELITEYPLSYPTAYSVLDLGETELRYLPRRVDVDAWAAASGADDPVLLRYAAWQQETLRAYSRENVAYMSQRNPVSRREQEDAADFFYETMDAFWRGKLHEQRAELEAMPGYEPFFRCAEGYAYGWWLRDLMDSAGPLLRGFTLNIRET